MKIDDFKAALKMVSKAVGPDLPFNRVRIEYDKLIARDRTISAVVNLPNSLECDILIDYLAATAVVKRMPETSHVAYNSASETLVVSSGRTRASIAVAPEDPENITPIVINQTNGVSIIRPDAVEFAKQVIALLQYQCGGDVQPPWLGALMQVNGKLMVIGEGSKIIAWVDDRWLVPGGVIDSMIPRRFTEQLDETDDPPRQILIGGGAASIFWDTAVFSTMMMAGEPQRSLGSLISQWTEPEWRIPDEFSETASLVSDLTYGDVTISGDEITGRSRAGETVVRAAASVPRGTSIVIPQASLASVVKTAHKWQINADSPSPFIVGPVHGLVGTRTPS